MDCQKLKLDGNEFFKLKDYKNAIKCYRECIDLGPESDVLLSLYNNLAQCYIFQNDYNTAIKYASEVIEKKPQDIKALYRRATSYEKLENYKDALIDVRRVLSFDPQNKAAQELARSLESRIQSLISNNETLSGKIDSMFNLISKKSEKMRVSISNLIALLNEEPRAAHELIWNHKSFPFIYDLSSGDPEIVQLVQILLGKLTSKSPARGKSVLSKLTPLYFISNIYSHNVILAQQTVNFLGSILESLTQVKEYHENIEAINKKNPVQGLPRSNKLYKLSPEVATEVTEILSHLVKAINSYKLKAQVRDTLIELLVQFIPKDIGINWTMDLLKLPGAIERMLDIASAVAQSALSIKLAKRRGPASHEDEAQVLESSLSDGIPLSTTTNTRMILACLFSKIWGDIVSDQAREQVIKTCTDYILDLLGDIFIESKVEAASIIGTLFHGPYELGNAILSHAGIIEGMMLLSQSSILSHQTVALDTIILATNKKDQCLGIVKQAVPLLKTLYKSPNDSIKIRALVGLCKLGVAGGSDASIRTLGEGSTLNLAKSCKRLLTSNLQAYNQLKIGKMKPLQSDTENTIVCNEEESFENLRWAIDGFAFLSLDAQVKEWIVQDKELLKTIFNLTKVDKLELGFPLASLFGHLCNSQERKEIAPEMVELAQYAKQHIPEEHELDLPMHVEARRELLLKEGIATALYNCTFKMASGPIGARPTLREELSKVFLAICEPVKTRGLVVSAGGGKALLDLASNKLNTDSGRVSACHALAKLAINMDPRIVFPGQRSLETIRPILQLLNIECTALQTFEGLLALTNLASLDETHRHRIMAEHGVPQIDQYLFEEHEHLRRASTELFSNMAQYHAFVVNCGGILPMDDSMISIGKELTILGSTDRVKLLVLYCAEIDDLPLISAASATLASMSYDPGIIKKITEVNSWFEIVQNLACIDAPAIQHRAAFLLREIISHGEKSLAEYLSKSSIFEVLLALSQLEDIDQNTESLPPGCIILGQGLSKEVIMQKACKDRTETKRWAQEALEKLQEYGFVMAVSPEHVKDIRNIQKEIKKKKELATVEE